MPTLARPAPAPDSAFDDPRDALLRQGAAVLGLSLDAAQRAQFARYAQLLAQWGEKINLTALRDPQQVVVRHFLDSLALVRHLPAPVSAAPLRLVDVGSGAGFPGAVCALLRPELQVTLVERISKKAAFLLALRRELGLRYEVVCADAAQLGERFDLVVSRAALPLPRWLALGSGLLAPGGALLAMTSPSEPVPPPPPGCAQTLDVTYDVGAGPHRLLGWQRPASPAAAAG